MPGDCTSQEGFGLAIVLTPDRRDGRLVQGLVAGGVRRQGIGKMLASLVVVPLFERLAATPKIGFEDQLAGRTQAGIEVEGFVQTCDAVSDTTLDQLDPSELPVALAGLRIQQDAALELPLGFPQAVALEQVETATVGAVKVRRVLVDRVGQGRLTGADAEEGYSEEGGTHGQADRPQLGNRHLLSGRGDTE